jgi:hypothetical protein
MIRFSWLLGPVLLFACGVESAPVASQSQSASVAGESVTSSALAHPASAMSASGSPQIAEVCTPGDFRFCCPFAHGCTCPGDQFCEDDGQWDECYGASPAPGPCL